MTTLDVLLSRNQAFADDADARRGLTDKPAAGTFVICCIDPRVHPTQFLGVGINDAVVLRNAGGRVTEAAMADLAFISYLKENVLAPDAPAMEVAVIHHTLCGTSFLADDGFRRAFAARTGLDDAVLADEAVTDPEVTVRAGVARLLSSPLASPHVAVSGHVLDLATGLIRTVVPATAPAAATTTTPP
jgi:carbonic anhydrase